MDQEVLCALAFYFKKGFGFKRIEQIVERFGSFAVAYKSMKFDLCEEIKRADKEIEKAVQLGVEIYTVTSDKFPAILKNIVHPPPVIYVKGNFNPSYGIAIVGSRKCSRYGRKIASQLAGFLSSKDLIVVSGLAYGIDTAAHEGVVGVSGTTYAVLGCGIDFNYPAGNAVLKERILDAGGAIISEFPFGTSPSRENFPRRNRIISGLSVATVVVEANDSSGALITAQFALEQGRELFVVPANIDSFYSKGSNKLLKSGAVPLIDFEQIFEEISYLKVNFERDLSVEFDESYMPILNVLRKGDVHIDKIIAESGISYCETIALLFEMESKGIVKSDNGRYFLTKEGGLF